jgi:formate dehydrogenase assembly factor FdhD
MSVTHVTSSHLAALFVLQDRPHMGEEDIKRRNALRRTAAMQLGTAASALSVFSFVRGIV